MQIRRYRDFFMIAIRIFQVLFFSWAEKDRRETRARKKADLSTPLIFWKEQFRIHIVQIVYIADYAMLINYYYEPVT